MVMYIDDDDDKMTDIINDDDIRIGICNIVGWHCATLCGVLLFWSRY